MSSTFNGIGHVWVSLKLELDDAAEIQLAHMGASFEAMLGCRVVRNIYAAYTPHIQ